MLLEETAQLPLPDAEPLRERLRPSPVERPADWPLARGATRLVRCRVSSSATILAAQASASPIDILRTVAITGHWPCSGRTRVMD